MSKYGPKSKFYQELERSVSKAERDMLINHLSNRPELPVYKISRWQIINGWIRIWIWGWCPKCNSDGPGIDDCIICLGATNSPFKNRPKKKALWNKFKSRFKIKDS